MRKLSMAVGATVLALAPVLAAAAPAVSSAPHAGRAGITLVQGWWEREGRHEELRDRYWRLPPYERDRYNRLQYDIERLERRQHREWREGDRPEAREIAQRIDELRREQWRILRYGG
jgi:Spy/CpxP family protein refolding chaperone